MHLPGVTEVDPEVRAAEEVARVRLAHTKSQDHGLGPMLGMVVPGGPLGLALGTAIAGALEPRIVKKIADTPEANKTGYPSPGALALAAQLDGKWAPTETRADDPVDRTDKAEDPDQSAAPTLPDPWADLPAVTSDALAPELQPEVAPVPNVLTMPPGAPGPNELTPSTPADYPGAAPWAADPWASGSDPWAGATDPWSVGPQPSSGPWAAGDSTASNPSTAAPASERNSRRR
jgi:hypothetical protein